MPKMTLSPFVVAIDGPASSGKGTIARLIAKHYNWAHLDTGLTYRAVAAAMLESDFDLENEQMAIKIAQNLDITHLNADYLSQNFIGEAASKIAILQHVRQILVSKQQDFIKNHEFSVLDGRDISTVVWPEAAVKFFITASAEERARRRFNQLKSQPNAPSYNEILNSLKERDFRDQNRQYSPLRQSDNVYLLDTTKKSIKETLTEAIIQIDKCRPE